jgi:endonuclease YncB( thermonuclease family)
MFKLLRKVLIGLLLVIVSTIAFYFLHNPLYRRELAQKAEEVKEDLHDEKKKPAWSGPAVVVDALKGDKVVVNTETSQRAIVRLVGIDAPEMPVSHARPGQPLAEESRQYLVKLAKDKAVEMAVVGTDASRFPLALLTVDGILINAKMTEAGMAEATTEYAEKIPAKQRHAIENAELSAKENHLGIWGLTNYVRPVEFRIRQH